MQRCCQTQFNLAGSGNLVAARARASKREKVVLVLNYLSTTPWRRMGSGFIDPPFLGLSE
jgi:hypothetical protein